jgi:hypothetical protein
VNKEKKREENRKKIKCTSLGFYSVDMSTGTEQNIVIERTCSWSEPMKATSTACNQGGDDNCDQF